MSILLVLMVTLLAACTDEAASIRTLESSGFSEISLKGYDAFACGKGDHFATRFRAKNPQGRFVSGVVCCGMVKSCTIRF